MKILITGGAGFIGSAVVRLAIARGHTVVNVDSLTYAACLENLISVSKHPNYAFEQVDIRDRLALDAVFAKHKPDAAMHLAAESHVDRSIDGPADFIDTNINGTFNILEAALSYWQAQGQPETFRFHHISTDEVFGSLGPTGIFTEDTRYDPRSPYSASKASSDHLVRAWHQTYGLPVVLTNCSNNYGSYHFPEKLIPVAILNALAGKPIPIYGDGGHIRDWLYVEDHVAAIDLIFNKGKVGETYNIGGNNELHNIQIVNQLIAIVDSQLGRPEGYSKKLITYVTDRLGHDYRYAIDSTKIQKELCWTPKTAFQEGLEKTVISYLKMIKSN